VRDRYAYQAHYVPIEAYHNRKALLARVAVDGKMPFRGEGQSGFDLYSVHVVDLPGPDSAEVVAIRTGVSVALPLGHFGLVVPKSDVAMSRGLVIYDNVIGPGHRGEVIIHARSAMFLRRIDAGEAFAILIVVPYCMAGVREVEVLPGLP